MLKKTFLSPFFMPLFFIITWGCFLAYVFMYHGNSILSFVKNGKFIEDVSHLGYMVLVACLLWYCDDFKDKIKSWGIFLFLSMCTFLREYGIHRHLSKTDTTPFKSRFFLNPDNPVGEKIVFGILLIIIAVAVGYLAVKYSKFLVTSFFKLNTISWSVATMCTIGLVSKIIDRFPSNYRKANGVELSDSVYEILQLIEESSEMFLPYIAVMTIVQYHIEYKKR
ncbi:MAG: hypothetical protein IJZ59_06145 [Alphaproteobacteria bacterium]|nr:hypothetical protein [Alphaproteobacteria bacterium]